MDPFPKLILKNFFNFNFFKRQGLCANGMVFNPLL